MIRYEFLFILIKYELIHFIKNLKKFDITITIKIESNNHTIENRHTNFEDSDRHSSEMKFAYTKNSKEDDKAFHVFTKMWTFT